MIARLDTRFRHNTVPCYCTAALVVVFWSNRVAFPSIGQFPARAPSADSAAFAFPFLFHATAMVLISFVVVVPAAAAAAG